MSYAYEKRIPVAPGVDLAVVHRSASGGPTIVFSNSLAADRSMWDEVVLALPNGYGVVTYDIRGHGQSDIAMGVFGISDLGTDVLGILDALGIGAAVFCGLSIGGLIGMWLAANHSSRIQKLVLANTAINFSPASMWTDRAALARAEGLGQLVMPTLERWLTSEFRTKNPYRTHEVADMIATTPPEGYAACCMVLANTDCSADLGKIVCPVLVIAGSSDPSTPPARADEIAAGLTDVNRVTLDAAHLSSVEKPEAFAGALVASCNG